MNAYELGATLYVPALHRSLLEIANGRKVPGLRSVVVCTEDAIKESDLYQALDRIADALPRLEPTNLRRFIRVRNPQVLDQCLSMPGIHAIHGFVVPKVDSTTLRCYLDRLSAAFNGYLMLTIETGRAFDVNEMIRLREQLTQLDVKRRIVSLRVGGNDLLQILGLRRPRGTTIYSTPIGALINQLVMIFRPYGFNLTGPVFEYLDCPGLLRREVRRDLAMGLFGKTAIHPMQIPVIESQYRVSRRDLRAAERIMAADAEAVFAWDGAMCEPSTHRRWAESILMRAELYGVVDNEYVKAGMCRRKRRKGE